MRKVTLFIFAFMISLLISESALCQDDGVVMLDEIRITVEPEMPNVFVTIPRQNPVIEVGELKRPEDSKLFSEAIVVKPKLTDLEVSKLEKVRKILAKDRKQ
ncbi:MAG: hypothetical protein HQ568_02815 [Calditrichaeota bacterium]|nr:hypothetical protein [Calditrichota bacterium]